MFCKGWRGNPWPALLPEPVYPLKKWQETHHEHAQDRGIHPGGVCFPARRSRRTTPAPARTIPWITGPMSRAPWVALALALALALAPVPVPAPAAWTAEPVRAQARPICRVRQIVRPPLPAVTRAPVPIPARMAPPVRRVPLVPAARAASAALTDSANSTTARQASGFRAVSRPAGDRSAEDRGAGETLAARMCRKRKRRLEVRR